MVDSISVQPLRIMKTPTAWNPSPETLNQTNLRIVSALAARLLQSGGGRTPYWKYVVKKWK
jgi:hypothetical protein